MKNFSHNNGVIGGLVPNSANYQYIISVAIEINGVTHDVPQTQLIDSGITAAINKFIINTTKV